MSFLSFLLTSRKIGPVSRADPVEAMAPPPLEEMEEVNFCVFFWGDANKKHWKTQKKHGKKNRHREIVGDDLRGEAKRSIIFCCC